MALSIEEKARRRQRKSPPSPAYPKSIILDGVKASDLRQLNVIYHCEQCVYFDPSNARCAMGFKVEKHMKAYQDRLYELTGKFAMCRSLEID